MVDKLSKKCYNTTMETSKTKKTARKILKKVKDKTTDVAPNVLYTRYKSNKSEKQEDNYQ